CGSHFQISFVQNTCIPCFKLNDRGKKWPDCLLTSQVVVVIKIKRASTSQGKTRPQITDPAEHAGNSSTDTSLIQEPLEASTPVLNETSRVLPSGGSQLFETPRTTATENHRRSSFLSLLPPRNTTDHEDHGDSQADIANQLNEFFKRQDAFNKSIEEKVQLALNETAEKTRQSKRLPKELSSNVRAVYDKSDKKWDLSKKFNDQDREINAAILAGVRSTDSKTSTALIMRAMRVHFKTKKRQRQNKEQKKDSQVLKEQRKRSRLNSKKANRIKALNQSTSIAEDDNKKNTATS
ncbi:uncharacterized protein LOC116289209, partial [Actinia tenebrosa]|uniref:Uncharacterized protein LOC116289209 n=1 Tax=Actinia tenebrosa TaxID=6105 RepID=A0A6P8H6C6_ACTTE